MYMEEEVVLRKKEIYKSFGPVQVLERGDLNLKRGEVLGLIEEALSKAEAASEEVNTEAGDNMEGEAEPEPDQVESGGDEEADQTA